MKKYSDPLQMFEHVYAEMPPYLKEQREEFKKELSEAGKEEAMAKMTMVQALNLALRQEMEKDDRVIVLGEDVGRDGGVFRVTDGLIDLFGENRSIDTPLAESCIVGMSIGMAIYGLRPVCEIQFSGSATSACIRSKATLRE